tara:strand:- start:1789 stop:2262 length:474 start_codon:yes stop_codon:yes gene_type:complete
LITRRTTNSNHKRRNRNTARKNGFNRIFDNSSNLSKPRGSVPKILEKYLALAQDASSNGDRIKAEGYFQHAEHYQRVINSSSSNGELQVKKVLDVKNEGFNQSNNFSDDKKPSRTQRAEFQKNKRIESKEEGKDKKISVTTDGVEALKAFNGGLTDE